METRLYLESVALSGYRSYNQEENRILLGNYNLIIGANGSGKSNFLSFFEMLSFMMTRGLQNYTAKHGGASALLHIGAKEADRIRGQLRFSNAGYGDGAEGASNPQGACYNFALERGAGERLFFTNETASLKQGVKDLNLNFGNGHFESMLADNLYKWEIPDLWRGLSRLRVFHFNDTSISSNLRGMAKEDDNSYLYSNGWNLAAFLYRLEKDYPPYYQRIVRTIRRAMPQFNDFDLSPDENGFVRLNWTQAGAEYPFGAHHFSDGALRFIALTTLLLQPPEIAPYTIILDEPEIGLHPYALSLLAWELREAGKRSQIILATQSPTLLNSFSCEDIITADYDPNRNCSVLRRHSTEELKEWLEDYSLGELWEKNVLGGLPV